MYNSHSHIYPVKTIKYEKHKNSASIANCVPQIKWNTTASSQNWKLSSEYLAYSTDKLVISKRDDEPIRGG